MHDDAEARSQFGTKAYWDDMYRGFGDFAMEEYEWYFGWPDIKPYFQEHVHTTSKVLIPGMGNDPLLLDLVGAGYGDITAFDYSEGAVARQARGCRDLALQGCSGAGRGMDRCVRCDPREGLLGRVVPFRRHRRERPKSGRRIASCAKARWHLHVRQWRRAGGLTTGDM